MVKHKVFLFHLCIILLIIMLCYLLGSNFIWVVIKLLYIITMFNDINRRNKLKYQLPCEISPLYACIEKIMAIKKKRSNHRVGLYSQD